MIATAVDYRCPDIAGCPAHVDRRAEEHDPRAPRAKRRREIHNGLNDVRHREDRRRRRVDQRSFGYGCYCPPHTCGCSVCASRDTIMYICTPYARAECVSEKLAVSRISHSVVNGCSLDRARRRPAAPRALPAVRRSRRHADRPRAFGALRCDSCTARRLVVCLDCGAIRFCKEVPFDRFETCPSVVAGHPGRAPWRGDRPDARRDGPAAEGRRTDRRVLGRKQTEAVGRAVDAREPVGQLLGRAVDRRAITTAVAAARSAANICHPPPPSPPACLPAVECSFPGGCLVSVRPLSPPLTPPCRGQGWTRRPAGQCGTTSRPRRPAGPSC